MSSNKTTATTIDQQNLLINREWSYNNQWSRVEVSTTTSSFQNNNYWSMKLEQQLLINMEWSSNKNYSSTGNELRTIPIDQQEMKLKQHLLINKEWS